MVENFTLNNAQLNYFRKYASKANHSNTDSIMHVDVHGMLSRYLIGQLGFQAMIGR